MLRRQCTNKNREVSRRKKKEVCNIYVLKYTSYHLMICRKLVISTTYAVLVIANKNDGVMISTNISIDGGVHKWASVT